MIHKNKLHKLNAFNVNNKTIIRLFFIVDKLCNYNKTYMKGPDNSLHTVPYLLHKKFLF